MRNSKRKRQGGSYEYVTLRPSNIEFVADLTEKSVAELKNLLAAAKEKGLQEVKLPIGPNYFTRHER